VVSFISWSLYPSGNMPQCTRLPGTRGGLDVQEGRGVERRRKKERKKEKTPISATN